MPHRLLSSSLCAAWMLLQNSRINSLLSYWRLDDLLVSLHLLEPLFHTKWAVLITLLQDNKQIHEASTRTNWAWFAIDSSFLAEQLVNWIKTKICGFLASFGLGHWCVCSLRSFSEHSGSWTKELKCPVCMAMTFPTGTGEQRECREALTGQRKGEKEFNIHLMPTTC